MHQAEKIIDRKATLSPASENIWYVLATIAGEPRDNYDQTIVLQNRHFWNGLMATRLSSEKLKKLLDGDGKKITLPVLSESEWGVIISVLEKNSATLEGLESKISFS